MIARGGPGWLEALGLTITVGVMNGIGINTAHELGHKKEETERLLAKIALAPLAYGHFEESPQLPSGYASMIVLVLVPQLWRRVMDWRVTAHYAGDLAQANVHQSLRARAVS